MDSAVGDNVAKPGGVGEAGDKLVVPCTDVDEVGATVAEDVWEGFRFFAVATGGGGGGPACFDCVDWEDV